MSYSAVTGSSSSERSTGGAVEVGIVVVWCE